MSSKQVQGHDAATSAGGGWRRLRPPHVEFGRLLCDDGHSASCRGGTGKTQDSRGVDGRTVTGLDAASRMRQECPVSQDSHRMVVLRNAIILWYSMLGRSLRRTNLRTRDPDWAGHAPFTRADDMECRPQYAILDGA